MEVLDRLRNINRTSRAKSFDSFDFSTLYTNIPHEALKSNIRNLIREAFKVRVSKYLIVSKDGKAHWSLEPSLWSACVSVDNSKLVEWTNYLIDNVYIKVGSKVYRCIDRLLAFLWEQIVHPSWQTCSFFITSTHI